MADVKISALPASTTPLAGTEVLPIVQSATTRQVSVANLTAGRAVNALSIATTTGATFATTSGNVGIGATPSAWNAVFKVLNLSDSFNIYGQTNDPASGGLVANAYFDTSNFVYKSTGFATHYAQTNGTHIWYTAPSGTAAGAVTFTENMRITNAGDVGIGTSSPAYKIEASSSTNNYIGVTCTVDGNAASRFKNNQRDWLVGVLGSTSGALGFYDITAGAERMRIDSSGSLIVGTTTNPATGTDRGVALFKQLNDSSAFSGIQLEANANTTLLGIGYNGSAFNFNASYRSTGSFVPMSFNVGNSERMRIDTSGNLLVGTTSALDVGKISVKYDGAPQNGISITPSDGTSNTGYIVFENESNTRIGSVTRVTTTNAVIYNTTSDYRLKTVTGSVTGQGERIDALKPIDYQWKEGNQQARGFLAHEFQTVYPNSVSGEKDAVDTDGKPVYQGMQASTAEVIADLVAEIQSLRQRIATLENK